MPIKKRHMPIEETDFFQDYELIANWAWIIVENWNHHHQSTIGKQLVRAIDSVGANLVEGDGRFSNADSIYFFVIARASARESKLWIERATKRGLIDSESATFRIDLLTSATRRLNLFINFRRKLGNPKYASSLQMSEKNSKTSESTANEMIKESIAIYAETDSSLLQDRELLNQNPFVEQP